MMWLIVPYLYCILLVGPVITEADDDTVYAVPNTELRMNWMLSNCPDDNTIEIQQDIPSQPDMAPKQVVDPFKCRDFSEGFQDSGGVYEKARAGFNVSVVSEPPWITLVFSNVQMRDTGLYEMRVLGISEDGKNLVVYEASDLEVELELDGKAFTGNDPVTFTDDSAKKLVIRLKDTVPVSALVEVLGVPSGRVVDSMECYKTSPCVLTLEPPRQGDSRLQVVVSYPQVHGSEATTVLVSTGESEEEGGLSGGAIVGIIVVALLVCVAVVVVVVLWRMKQCCFKTNQPANDEEEKGMLENNVPVQPSAEPAPYTDFTDIRQQEFEAEFKQGHFDCALVYSDTEADRKLALNFKIIMERLVTLDDGRPAAVCVVDSNEDIAYIQSRFKRADEASDRSTYMFMVMTKNLDLWAKRQKDECLQRSIEEQDKAYTLVPLHTAPKKDIDWKYPWGMRSLVGVDIWDMLSGDQQLADLSMPQAEAITSEHIKPRFIENITKMFNTRLAAKLKREKEQEQKKQLWLEEENVRRLAEAKDHKDKKADLSYQQTMSELEGKERENKENERLEQLRAEKMDAAGDNNVQMSNNTGQDHVSLDMGVDDVLEDPVGESSGDVRC